MGHIGGASPIAQQVGGGNCASKIGDVLAKLDDIYNCNYGKVQVSAVIGLMSQWSQQDHGGADSPAEVADEGQDRIQGMLAKLDACNGLVLPVKDIPVVTQFLQKLASNIDSDQRTKLGLMVTQMLPVLDASSCEAHTHGQFSLGACDLRVEARCTRPRRCGFAC